ncbi:hypothetical protein [Clostridium vitabionis]|uniref:hypothetical protein n=1 Tax=Clostridium vitabionis TaxID=2784388 RepID=UPI00188A671A|nr:hypothetical protein [Clostridium vitabionis]
MKNRVISLAVFGLLLILSLFSVWRALSFKYIDGIRQAEMFYRQPENSIDVLCVGSSHCFCDLDPGEMYRYAGIAAYDFSASEQPFWYSYEDIRTALKTQKPKLVVLEGYAAIHVPVDSESSRVIKNTFGLRAADRFRAILGAESRADAPDYLLGYRWWHSRWRDLHEDDFEKTDVYRNEDFKGGTYASGTKPQERPAVENFSKESLPLQEREEEFFRKIMELCREKQVPVLVMVSPYILTEADQMHFQALRDIAEDYQAPFVNFNSAAWYGKLGLDFSTDFAEESHLNYRGNRKLTDALCDLLRGGEDADTGNAPAGIPDLPDRRGDAAYASWAGYAADMEAQAAMFGLRDADSAEALLDGISGNADLCTYLVTYSDTAQIDRETGLSAKLWGGSAPAGGAAPTGGSAPAGGSASVNPFTPEDGAVYRIAGGTAELLGSGTYFCEDELDHRTLSIRRTLDPDTGEALSHSIFYKDHEYLDDASGDWLVIYDERCRDLAAVYRIGVGEDGEVTLAKK